MEGVQLAIPCRHFAHSLPGADDWQKSQAARVNPCSPCAVLYLVTHSFCQCRRHVWKKESHPVPSPPFFLFFYFLTWDLYWRRRKRLWKWHPGIKSFSKKVPSHCIAYSPAMSPRDSLKCQKSSSFFLLVSTRTLHLVFLELSSSLCS